MNGNEHRNPVALMNASIDDTGIDTVDMTMLAGLDDARIEGAPNLVIELIDLYLDDSLHKMAAMREAIKEMDEISLKRVAHNFKGGSASLGVRRMAVLCEQLELVDCNNSPQKAGALLTEMEREFERVRQVFTAERQMRL